MAAIPRTAQSGEPGATTAPDPTQSTAHNPLSRYPPSVTGSGALPSVDTQLASIAEGGGGTAVQRSVYLGSVLAASTGVDPKVAIQQVEDYKDQTGYYPDVGQSMYGLTSEQRDKIYGPSAGGVASGAGSAAGGATTQAGMLSGFLNNPIMLALLLGAGVLAFALFGKKGKGGGHRGR